MNNYLLLTLQGPGTVLTRANFFTMHIIEDEFHKKTLAFKLGEEPGFNFFFELYHRGLVLYSVQITGDMPASEEIAGDVFVKIWEQRISFTHHNEIKSWLYKA